MLLGVEHFTSGNAEREAAKKQKQEQKVEKAKRKAEEEAQREADEKKKQAKKKNAWASFGFTKQVGATPHTDRKRRRDC